MHKDAISLSGSADKIMFKNSNEQKYDDVECELKPVYNDDGEFAQKKEIYNNKVHLINEENKDCFIC